MWGGAPTSRLLPLESVGVGSETTFLKQLPKFVPEPPVFTSLCSVHVVGQGVDEQDEVRWLELETVEIRAPAPLHVDHVRDHTVNLIAITLLREFVTETLYQFPRCHEPIRTTGEKRPVHWIQTMGLSVCPHD